MILTAFSTLLRKFNGLQSWWGRPWAQKMHTEDSLISKLIRAYLSIKLVECLINYVFYVDCYYEVLYLYEVELARCPIYQCISRLFSIKWVSIFVQKHGHYAPTIYPSGGHWYRLVLCQKLLLLKRDLLLTIFSFCIYAYIYYVMLILDSPLDSAQSTKPKAFSSPSKPEVMPNFIMNAPIQSRIEGLNDVEWVGE